MKKTKIVCTIGPKTESVADYALTFLPECKSGTQSSTAANWAETVSALHMNYSKIGQQTVIFGQEQNPPFQIKMK